MSDILQNILNTRQRVDDSIAEFNKVANPITWVTNHLAQKSIQNRFADGNYEGGIVKNGKQDISFLEYLGGATSADAKKGFDKSVKAAKKKADPYLFPSSTAKDEVRRRADISSSVDRSSAERMLSILPRKIMLSESDVS